MWRSVRRFALILAMSLAASCGGEEGRPAESVDATPVPTPEGAPGVRSRRRTIWIGDSLAARGWRGIAVAKVPGSFAVDSDPLDPLVRITTVAPHGLGVGHRIQLINPGDGSYSAPLNGRVLRVRSTPAPDVLVVSARTTSGVMPPGDYSAGYGNEPWLIRILTQGTDESWLQALNVLLGGYFEIVANYAVGGARSSVAAQLAEVIAAGPEADAAFVQTCTNDINAVEPPAVSDCITNLEKVLDVLRARKILTFVATPAAIGDPQAQPRDPGSASKGAALVTLRGLLDDLRRRRGDFVLLDILAASADSADPWQRFRPGYAPADGIHPSSFGALEIARAVLPSVREWIPPTDWLVRADDDPNLLINGTMRGDTGSIASDAEHLLSGTMPIGWSIRGHGGTVAAPLQVHVSGEGVLSGMPGGSLDVHVETATSAHTLEIGSNGSGGSSFHGRLERGRWYRCGVELRAQTPMSVVQMHGQVFLARGSAAPVLVQFMVPTSEAFANGMRLEPGEPLQYISQPFPVDEVYTGAWLFMTLRFSDSVSHAKLSIGRATCREVTNPYD